MLPPGRPQWVPQASVDNGNANGSISGEDHEVMGYTDDEEAEINADPDADGEPDDDNG